MVLEVGSLTLVYLVVTVNQFKIMKKVDKSNSLLNEGTVEYAALTQPNTDVEYRSEANIDDDDIRSHWQKKVIKHQPPIIRTMEDLKRLKSEEKT